MKTEQEKEQIFLIVYTKMYKAMKAEQHLINAYSAIKLEYPITKDLAAICAEIIIDLTEETDEYFIEKLIELIVELPSIDDLNSLKMKYYALYDKANKEAFVEYYESYDGLRIGYLNLK